MSVDFEIMQDIPENKRGLDHWANPRWLSVNQVHRERLASMYFNDYANERKSSDGYIQANKKRRKGITLITESGEIISYESQRDAAEDLGFKNFLNSPITNAIRTKGETLEDGTIKVKLLGSFYRVVKE